MAGQQFQYDDSGNTFFYFLTSFVGLIVIPATYYLWPRDQNAGESRWQLAEDPLRPRRRLRAAPRRFSPARRVRGDPARAARPRVQAPATGGARARCCPRCLSGRLATTLHCPAQEFCFAPSFPIVLDTLRSLHLPLCLLCLWFYWVFFFMEGAGWDGEDGNWEVRKELAKEGAEGTTLSPQATTLFRPHPRFPVAAVVTDVLGPV